MKRNVLWYGEQQQHIIIEFIYYIILNVLVLSSITGELPEYVRPFDVGASAPPLALVHEHPETGARPKERSEELTVVGKQS